MLWPFLFFRSCVALVRLTLLCAEVDAKNAREKGCYSERGIEIGASDRGGEDAECYTCDAQAGNKGDSEARNIR